MDSAARGAWHRSTFSATSHWLAATGAMRAKPDQPPRMGTGTYSNNKLMVSLMAEKNDPQTPAEIAAALRELSERMFIVGTAMDYFGGFDKYMVERGAEMVGAAAIPLDWADAIEAKIAGKSA